MRSLAAILLLALLGVASTIRAQALDTPASNDTVGEPSVAPAKVALVVAGDPDAVLVAAADRVRDLLVANPGLLLPADAALSRALAGAAAPEEDDGYGEVRALRRRLRIDPGVDDDVLARLARHAGAIAVVIISRAPEPSLEVYDVARKAYFADRLQLATAEDAVVGRFVLRRARAAKSHSSESVAAVAAAPASETASATASEPAREDAAPPRRPNLRRNLAYVAAGALVIGVGVFFLVDRLKDDPAPILRIRPGGE
ncbi:MAG: hypothetical protein H5U40_18590 [Polyangiaceae bacterium]|nr:hypothetical protein [Polyangiaceae bacterium]